MSQLTDWSKLRAALTSDPLGGVISLDPSATYSEFAQIRSIVRGASCACGRMPDPGYKPGGGCLCPSARRPHPDNPRGRRKPALYFEAGQWWAQCAAERNDAWNLAALRWVEDRNA